MIDILQAVVQALGLVGLLIEGCVLLIPDRLDQWAVKVQRSADLTAETRTKVRAARELARIKRQVLRLLVRNSNTEEAGPITYLRAVPPQSVPIGLNCSLAELNELYTEVARRFAHGRRILDPYVNAIDAQVDVFIRTHRPDLDNGSPRGEQPGAVTAATWATILSILIAWAAVVHLSTVLPPSLVLLAGGSALCVATIPALVFVSDIARPIAELVATFVAALLRAVRSELARKLAYLCVAFYALDVAQALSDAVRWIASTIGVPVG